MPSLKIDIKRKHGDHDLVPGDGWVQCLTAVPNCPKGLGHAFCSSQVQPVVLVLSFLVFSLSQTFTPLCHKKLSSQKDDDPYRVTSPLFYKIFGTEYNSQCPDPACRLWLRVDLEATVSRWDKFGTNSLSQ